MSGLSELESLSDAEATEASATERQDASDAADRGAWALLGAQRPQVASIWPLLIFLVGSASALLLVLWPDYLPMVDAPNHLARLHILTSPPNSPLRGMYTVAWKLIPDLGLDLTYVALHDAISPETTIRFCVLLSFALMLGAVWTIQRAIFGRLSYSAAAAPIFLFGSPWHMGYVNYLMGTSVALTALAVYLAAGRRITPVIAAVLSVAGAVMLVCHVAAFASFALLLSGLHLSDGALRTSTAASSALRPQMHSNRDRAHPRRGGLSPV